MQRLRDKNIVIIGGTSGLGLSAALALRREGASLVVVGRDDAHLAAARRNLGAETLVLPGDATRTAVAEHAVAETVSRFGKLDGLYHVAGGSGRSAGDGPLHALTDAGLASTTALNYFSVAYSNRAAIRAFRAQKTGGCIVNMSSVLAFSPAPAYFATHAYAAAKAAVIGFSKAIAATYAPENIRVNVVAPALTATPMSARAAQDDKIMHYIKTKQPLDGGRIGRPEDLDEAVVYLLSDAARFITGQVLAIDGGWTMSEGQI